MDAIFGHKGMVLRGCFPDHSLPNKEGGGRVRCNLSALRRSASRKRVSSVCFMFQYRYLSFQFMSYPLQSRGQRPFPYVHDIGNLCQ